MSRPALLVALLAVAAACTSGGRERAVDAEIIEVFGPWRGNDADRFAEVLAPFEESFGVEVRYVGSVDFVADLLDRTGEGNDPPDVAIIPQPSVVRQLVDDGKLVPLSAETAEQVSTNFGSDVVTLGAVDGIQYTVPYRVTVKSLVWYRPDVFAEHGWTVPSTLDELEVLVQDIAETDGIAPWCFGINAGSATGWAATDWIEDLAVRSIGPERYREWARGEIRFDDPAIADVFEQFSALVLAPGRIFGGAQAIIETPVERSIEPLLGDTPGCALHRQADFAINWLPHDTSIGPDGDVDAFLLPGRTEAPPPILIGGFQAAQFDAREDVGLLMAYLSSAQAAEIWARRGGFLSLHREVSEDAYPDGYLRRLTTALEDVPAIVFDASDQMPPEIGAGLLWDRITAWVTGATGYAEFAAAVDDARAEATSP